LERLNLNDVKVEVTDTTDHYDPLQKTIRLTKNTCGRKTLTAVVVAAHEVGHAIQDQAGYKPLKTRTRMIGTAQKLERIGAVIMMAIPVLAALTRAPSIGVLMFLGGLGTLGSLTPASTAPFPCCHPETIFHRRIFRPPEKFCLPAR